MTLTVKDVAERLNGAEYPVHMSREFRNELKRDGIVVAMGESDDLFSFYGAIDDDKYVYDGGTALIDREGLLPNRDDIDDDEMLERYFQRIKNPTEVKAIWAPSEELAGAPDVSWLIQMEPPHEMFNVMEDEGVFCRGVVFALSDLPK